MDTALLVIDIQKDFVGDQARMPVANHQIAPMIDNINTMIEKAKKAEMPIIYIGNEFEKTQFVSNWFRHNAAIKNSLGAELDERLLIVNDLYFSKKQGDALSNSRLVHYLEVNHIEHLMLTGLFAEGCITATAKGARRRNYKVTVIRDAVAGATDNKREKSLRRLASGGISILDSSAVL
jgi:nicotinamidase-related amidase